MADTLIYASERGDDGRLEELIKAGAGLDATNPVQAIRMRKRKTLLYQELHKHLLDLTTSIVSFYSCSHRWTLKYL